MMTGIIFGGPPRILVHRAVMTGVGCLLVGAAICFAKAQLPPGTFWPLTETAL